MTPFELGPNQLHRFYRGGEAIARFRGIPLDDDRAPEDWVGSTTTIFGEHDTGLSPLPDGRLLRDAVAAEPESFLGPEHIRRYGPDPMLLVKLLDAGERLPVHSHPDRRFARRHLDLPYGKTEAWLIVEARGVNPSIHLGFATDVELETLVAWVERQDAEALREAMNALAVEPGDCILVPAGIPHSIGEGVFMVEVQEPSDLSVLLEWHGFGVDGARDGHLGLGFEVALESVVRAALDAADLGRLKRGTDGAPEARPGVRALLSPDGDAYFRAERLQPNPTAPLEQGFSILVVLAGNGSLETERAGALALTRGMTILVPYASGAAEVTGAVDVIRCLPPAPE
jgi:mannose-6-phosphate isomerase